MTSPRVHLATRFLFTSRMESLRKRAPFKFVSDASEEAIKPDEILNEEEQEQLISTLREQDDLTNKLYFIGLKLVICLSIFLHIIHFFTPTNPSPFYAVFPPSSSSIASNSLSALFSRLLTLLALVVHLFVLYHLQSHTLPTHLSTLLQAETRRMYISLLAVSAVPSILGLWVVLWSLENITWQLLVWWGISPALVFFTHAVFRWMRDFESRVSELEGMRYDAKGA